MVINPTRIDHPKTASGHESSFSLTRQAQTNHYDRRTEYFRQSAKHQHFCTSILQKNKPALLTAIDADRNRKAARRAQASGAAG
eukprot:COSAG01_NODE_10357_length_2185_cov_19.300575_2_plen_84_part_00